MADELMAPDARAVPTARGIQWLTDGWELFKVAPGTWIAIVIVFFIISVGASLIPLVNLVMTLLGPVFLGGIMLGCAALGRGEPLEVQHLFAGFSNNLGHLVTIGLLYLAAMLVIALLAGIVIAITGIGIESLSANLAVLALVVLIALAAAVPVFMAYWFAPALIVLHGARPVAAAQASFTACLRNIGPFMVYGLVALVLLLIGTIPLGLGLLVVVPVLLASIYASYRDIFPAA